MNRPLDDHLLTFEEMVNIGSKTQRAFLVYALNQDQVELLILGFRGAKAEEKKYAILKSLQAIRRAVRQGEYNEARQKAQTWDGVNLMHNMGLRCSVNGELATQKDIVAFLRVPLSTLKSFLHRYADQFTPVKLSCQEIRKPLTGGRSRFFVSVAYLTLL